MPILDNGDGYKVASCGLGLNDVCFVLTFVKLFSSKFGFLYFSQYLGEKVVAIGYIVLERSIDKQDHLVDVVAFICAWEYRTNLESEIELSCLFGLEVNNLDY